MSNDSQRQAFDGTLKGLFQMFANYIIPSLFGGMEFIEALNIEVLPTPRRVDRVFKVWYHGEFHILHIEFETSNNDTATMTRILTYHALLHQQYLLPVITVIIYPFPVTVAESPYREQSGNEDLVVFKFHPLPLWKLDAERFMKLHEIWMYALLPVMVGVSNEILLQAVQEVIEYYKDQHDMIDRQIAWMATMLRRSTVLSPEDKKIMLDELNKYRDDPFITIYKEDPVMQSIIAQAVEEAKAETEARMKAETEARVKAEVDLAKAEAQAKVETEALQSTAVVLVEARFPELARIARENVERIHNPLELTRLVKQMATAPNKEAAAWVLESYAA